MWPGQAWCRRFLEGERSLGDPLLRATQGCHPPSPRDMPTPAIPGSLVIPGSISCTKEECQDHGHNPCSCYRNPQSGPAVGLCQPGPIPAPKQRPNAAYCVALQEALISVPCVDSMGIGWGRSGGHSEKCVCLGLPVPQRQPRASALVVVITPTTRGHSRLSLSPHNLKRGPGSCPRALTKSLPLVTAGYA